MVNITERDVRRAKIVNGVLAVLVLIPVICLSIFILRRTVFQDENVLLTQDTIVRNIQTEIENDSPHQIKFGGMTYEAAAHPEFLEIFQSGTWTEERSAEGSGERILLRFGELYEIIVYQNGMLKAWDGYAPSTTEDVVWYRTDSDMFEELKDYIAEYGTEAPNLRNSFFSK